jgi:hypothetical protein
MRTKLYTYAYTHTHTRTHARTHPHPHTYKQEAVYHEPFHDEPSTSQASHALEHADELLTLAAEIRKVKFDDSGDAASKVK